jgi:hypothetical protein
MFVSDTFITPDNGSSNGSIQVVIKGGKLPYRYIWSNGANTPTISNLSGGNYTLTVRDAANCVRMFSFTVKMNVAVSDPTSKGPYFAYPNPVNSGATLYWSTQVDVGKVRLSLMDLCGITLMEKTFAAVMGGEQYEWGVAVSAGVYLLRFEDSNGLVQILRYTIF